MFRVLLNLLIVAFATAVAQTANAISLADFQALLPAGETYVDLDGTNAPEAVTSWGFPDGSESAITVDGDGVDSGDVADDKDNDANANEIAMTLGGLASSTGYNIDVVIFGRSELNPGEDSVYDVEDGFTTGVLTTYVINANNSINDGTLVSGETTNGLFRIPLGVGTSDGSGNLVVYLGSNGGFNTSPETFVRTEIDGLIYSVIPEPSSMLLASMGLLGLVCRGKRRYI